MEDEDVEEMISEHLNSLLSRSIDRMYEFGLPDIDLYDKNDTSEEFNEDLVPQEISLLASIMYLSYMEEEKNKMKAFGLTFRSTELNVFSPANERKAFLDMIYKVEQSVINSISNYYSRDRLTWKEKSIYGDLQ